MNMPLYGTKQAAYCFSKTFVKHVKNMTYKQLKADLCLYFAWKDYILVILVKWVDDVIILGLSSFVELQCNLEKACKHKGGLTKYTGSKIMIDINSNSLGTVRFTQPVLVRKLVEEYKPTQGPVSKTPAVSGQVLV
jgi:hypothetical protein